MADALLEARALMREFGLEQRTRVLHGVDVALQRGEFSALIGPSGSGKSTLLNLLGLLDRPTSGSIVLDGTEVAGLGDDGLTRLRARTLGFVFQFHNLLAAFTALENVMLPAWADRGAPDARLRARATQLLCDVGLRHRLHHRGDELSGGEAQRVAVARALINDPPLVLADEPTGNLDTHTADDIFALLRRFHRERNTTFLVVTHDPRLAERCDRIVHLVDGRIVADARRGPEDEAPGAFSARALA
jgi:lipoprotein-releasing system ATP-binding protein